jgi:hypothetical protein
VWIDVSIKENIECAEGAHPRRAATFAAAIVFGSRFTRSRLTAHRAALRSEGLERNLC